MQKQNETKEFTDSLLTAYLDLRGFQIRPKVIGNQVSFEVTGENIDEAIQDFYSNPKIQFYTSAVHIKKSAA